MPGLDSTEREELYDETMEAVKKLKAFARLLAFRPPSSFSINKVHEVRADLVKLAEHFHEKMGD